MVFKLNNAEKVEIDNLPAYDPYQTATCPRCGYRWKYKGEGKSLGCSKCRLSIQDNAYSKAYNEAHKAEKRAYRQAHKAEIAADAKAYEQTPKWKAYRKAYEQTPKRKAYQKAYEQTPKCKAYRKAYRQAHKKKK